MSTAPPASPSPTSLHGEFAVNLLRLLQAYVLDWTSERVEYRVGEHVYARYFSDGAENIIWSKKPASDWEELIETCDVTFGIFPMHTTPLSVSSVAGVFLTHCADELKLTFCEDEEEGGKTEQERRTFQDVQDLVFRKAAPFLNIPDKVLEIITQDH